MFKHLFDAVGKEKFIVNKTTKASIITNESEIMDFIYKIKSFIQFFVQEYEGYGSDLVFLYIQSFRIHIGKYNLLKIKSYLPLPKKILNKKCCINIYNENENNIQQVDWPDLQSVPRELRKYWYQRYSLFHKFEKNDTLCMIPVRNHTQSASI